MAKNNEAKDDESTPAKSNKKLIIIVLAAVLLLGGAGSYLMFFRSSGEPAAPEPGAVTALEPVTINLADGHYLKVALALQATADAHEELDGSKALDAAIDYFGDMKMSQLATSEARRKTKAALLEEISEAYHGEVMAIYFTEFVMQ